MNKDQRKRKRQRITFAVGSTWNTPRARGSRRSRRVEFRRPEERASCTRTILGKNAWTLIYSGWMRTSSKAPYCGKYPNYTWPATFPAAYFHCGRGCRLCLCLSFHLSHQLFLSKRPRDTDITTSDFTFTRFCWVAYPYPCSKVTGVSVKNLGDSGDEPSPYKARWRIA